MTKLWKKEVEQKLHPVVEQYTVGEDYILDRKLMLFDIKASLVHAQMLQKINILTSDELEIYFQSIGIQHELIHAWSQTNKIADRAKYAGLILGIDQFNKDREDFINIIKSFHKIEPHRSS